MPYLFLPSSSNDCLPIRSGSISFLTAWCGSEAPLRSTITAFLLLPTHMRGSYAITWYTMHFFLQEPASLVSTWVKSGCRSWSNNFNRDTTQKCSNCASKPTSLFCPSTLNGATGKWKRYKHIDACEVLQKTKSSNKSLLLWNSRKHFLQRDFLKTWWQFECVHWWKYDKESYCYSIDDVCC